MQLCAASGESAQKIGTLTLEGRRGDGVSALRVGPRPGGQGRARLFRRAGPLGREPDGRPAQAQRHEGQRQTLGSALALHAERLAGRQFAQHLGGVLARLGGGPDPSHRSRRIDQVGAALAQAQPAAEAAQHPVGPADALLRVGQQRKTQAAGVAKQRLAGLGVAADADDLGRVLRESRRARFSNPGLPGCTPGSSLWERNTGPPTARAAPAARGAGPHRFWPRTGARLWPGRNMPDSMRGGWARGKRPLGRRPTYHGREMPRPARS